MKFTTASRITRVVLRPTPVICLGSLIICFSPTIQSNTPSGQFVDVASESGLTDLIVCGASQSKKYILETLGSGVALFDYDCDGSLDAFFVNGSRLEGFAIGQAPTHHLYRNVGNGKFVDVAKAAGLAASGWGQ